MVYRIPNRLEFSLGYYKKTFWSFSGHTVHSKFGIVQFSLLSALGVACKQRYVECPDIYFHNVLCCSKNNREVKELLAEEQRVLRRKNDLKQRLCAETQKLQQNLQLYGRLITKLE